MLLVIGMLVCLLNDRLIFLLRLLEKLEHTLSEFLLLFSKLTFNLWVQFVGNLVWVLLKLKCQLNRFVQDSEELFPHDHTAFVWVGSFYRLNLNY